MDTYHRVRQAMALNSSLQSGGLKYIAKEAGIERDNRVYIDGSQLGKIWKENKEYNYNPTSGQWYSLDGVKPTPKMVDEKVMSGYQDKWEVVNGRFLLTEYLNDDLLETEQVDDTYTQAGFLTAALVAAKSSLKELSILTSDVLSPFAIFALLEETFSTLTST